MNLNNLCTDDLLDLYYEVRKDFKDACLIKGDIDLIREKLYMVKNEFRRREEMRRVLLEEKEK